ncbi:MAG: hypothetical protein IT246_10125 [Bacteroidia bacterium]|nr:hypothetical protein [Bacteroidia bacterium]
MKNELISEFNLIPFKKIDSINMFRMGGVYIFIDNNTNHVIKIGESKHLIKRFVNYFIDDKTDNNPKHITRNKIRKYVSEGNDVSIYYNPCTYKRKKKETEMINWFLQNNDGILPELNSIKK